MISCCLLLIIIIELRLYLRNDSMLPPRNSAHEWMHFSPYRYDGQERAKIEPAEPESACI
jgi:hypothetical protein